MATDKRSTSTRPEKAEHAPQITPMPFPGESPTVSLALAAARMYGLPPEEEKPAGPERRAKAKATKKPARSAAKAKAPAKKPARGAAKAKAAKKPGRTVTQAKAKAPAKRATRAKSR